MGRTKSYDRDELIGQAMELFRDNGFAATSTQMLVDELGINRFSLYAEFGSKQALFYEALKRYNHDVIEVSFGLLEAPTASVGEIEALLTFYGTGGEGRALGRGCLLCNTAIEFGYQDPTCDGFIEHYFQDISRAYYKALSNARKNGEIRENVAIKKEADFFTASTLGLFVLIRAQAKPSILKNAATMAIAHLRQL